MTRLDTKIPLQHTLTLSNNKNEKTKLIAFSQKMQGTLDEPGKKKLKKGFLIPIREKNCQLLLMQCDM